MSASKRHKVKAVGPRGPDGMASEYDFSGAGPNPFATGTTGADVVRLDGELARDLIPRALRSTLQARKRGR